MSKIGVVIAIGLLAWASAGQAQEVLRIGVPNAAYPPYVLVDEHNTVDGGVLYEVLTWVLADLDMRLEMELLPAQRAQQLLNIGQLDGNMYSPGWSSQAQQYLWLDTGIVLKDILLYRSDLPFIPDTGKSLQDTEIVTHIGYVYPILESYFKRARTRRLDKYTESEMLQSLVQAPTESARLVVMEAQVWQWYKARLNVGEHIKIKVSPLVVGCATLQLQLRDTPKLRALLPKLQAALAQRPKVAETCQETLKPY